MTLPKILFMPSCDTIGHAGRLLLVARIAREGLPGSIEFAGNGEYGALFPPEGFPFWEVSGGFQHNRLRFLYTKWSVPQLLAFFRESTLMIRGVVEGELELYRQHKPDFVVWDGRFTVPISTWIARIPFVSVFHPHLTPYSALPPVLPRNLPFFTRYPWLEFGARLPAPVQRPLARAFWRTLHGLFLKLYNAVLRDFGATPARSLEEAGYRARATIFPDLEITAPAVNLPKNSHWVGPLVWEPDLALPEPLVDRRDLIYVTMGVSGNADAYRPLIEGLAGLPGVEVVITLARRLRPEDLAPLPANVQAYDYLPGTEVAKRARLVICHSEPTMYQALAQGVPVVAVPFNIMQELAANRICALGAGLKLYSRELTADRIKRTVRRILENPRYRRAAKELGSQFRLEDGPRRAAAVILREAAAGRGPTP